MISPMPTLMGGSEARPSCVPNSGSAPGCAARARRPRQSGPRIFFTLREQAARQTGGVECWRQGFRAWKHCIRAGRAGPPRPVAHRGPCLPAGGRAACQLATPQLVPPQQQPGRSLARGGEAERAHVARSLALSAAATCPSQYTHTFKNWLALMASPMRSCMGAWVGMCGTQVLVV